jgi:hypothetical protein
MSAKTPRVSAAAVYAPELPDGRIRLDTEAWFSWLESPTTRSFSYPLYDRRCGYIRGYMTVRKEARQRGGSYWSVYCRSGGRLRKVYLGRSAKVTGTHLEEIARTLLAGLQSEE